MRPLERHLQSLLHAATAEVTLSTGGVQRAEQGTLVPFRAAVHSGPASFVMTESGFRRLEAWLIIPAAPIDINTHDHIYLPDINFPYTVTRVTHYPNHSEYNIEAINA